MDMASEVVIAPRQSLKSPLLFVSQRWLPFHLLPLLFLLQPDHPTVCLLVAAAAVEQATSHSLADNSRQSRSWSRTEEHQRPFHWLAYFTVDCIDNTHTLTLTAILSATLKEGEYMCKSSPSSSSLNYSRWLWLEVTVTPRHTAVIVTDDT